jgi:DNA-binding beta-propeller fold protein YncE
MKKRREERQNSSSYLVSRISDPVHRTSVGKDKTFNPGRGKFISFLISVLVLGALLSGAPVLTGCGNPLNPEDTLPFVRISASADNFTGDTLFIYAAFRDSVAFKEITVQTGSADAPLRTVHGPEDSVRLDTIALLWTQKLPLLQNGHRIDSIQLLVGDTVSNLLYIEVKNRRPYIQTLYLNGTPLALSINGGYVGGVNPQADNLIQIIAADPDSTDFKSIRWQIIGSSFDTNSYFSDSVYHWLSPVTDSASVESATIRLTDKMGVQTIYPFRVMVYREAGSIWMANVNAGQSGSEGYITKVTISGEEIFRLTGFGLVGGIDIDPPSPVGGDNQKTYVWMTETSSKRVLKLNENGAILATFSTGFSAPSLIAVHPATGNCWVADQKSSNRTALYRIVSDQLRATDSLTFNGDIKAVAVDPYETDVAYVAADSSVYKLQGLTIVDTLRYHQALDTASSWMPIDVGVDQGHVWVLGAEGVLYKKYKNDTTARIVRITGFYDPTAIAVDKKDTSCWVADTRNNRVVHVLGALRDSSHIDVDSSYGQGATRIQVITTLSGRALSLPKTLVLDPNEPRALWICDTNNGRIIKINATGVPLLTLTYTAGFYRGASQPMLIAINPL